MNVLDLDVYVCLNEYLDVCRFSNSRCVDYYVFCIFFVNQVNLRRLGLDLVDYHVLSTRATLLQTGTMATGRKPLWPRASSPSLLMRRYSGSTVATGRSRPSLLWSIAATGTVMSSARW
jgi:hypothetical protein